MKFFLCNCNCNCNSSNNSSPGHYLLNHHLIMTAQSFYVVILGWLITGSQLAWAQEFAVTQFGLEAKADIEESDQLFRNIYGEDFINEYRLLPALGEATVIPKSGHWYPESKGGLNITDVLIKYDRAFNGGKPLAYGWEARYKNSEVSWHGHCNGYAASSLRHREPQRDVQVGDVLFTRKDIKALLTGIYMGVRYRFLGGERCEKNPAKPLLPADRRACDDINAALFHLVLANWVGIRKQAIIFDRSADHEVWNFPLYSYESRATPVRASEAMRILGWAESEYLPNPSATRFLHVNTKIYYADAINDEEVLDHTEEEAENYQYILELDDDGRIIGGEWGLPSRNFHPDFLWVPLRIRPGVERDRANAHLDPEHVIRLWAKSRGLDSPEDEPSPYDLFDFSSTWGQFKTYNLTMGHLTSGSAFAFLPTMLNIFFKSPNIIGKSHQGMKIALDGRPFATPYLVDREKASVILPGGEPGITRYDLSLNLLYLYDLEDQERSIAIYNME